MSIEIIIGITVGLVAGYFVRKVQIASKVNSIEAKVARVEEEAKNKEKEILLEAKSKALEIVEEGKKSEAEFRNQILKVEDRLSKKEADLERRLGEADKSKEDLSNKKLEADKIKQQQSDKLQKISGLTIDEAKKVLLEATEKSVKEELVSLTHKLLSQTREDADRKARDIVSLAIQRCASEVTSETTTTAVTLPSEDMKGRIIGKEGRNIKTFEQMLGVEVIVDDTPDAVIISGFNSVRRHIAKLALENLIKDG